MTTLIRMDDRAPGGWWGRFWRRLGGRRVMVSSEHIAGVPYCLITLRTWEGTPWAELEETVGVNPVVFEKGVKLPAGLSVRVVDGEALRRRILLNGVMYALEEAARAGEVGHVALLDRFGRYAALLPRLMQVCRAVTVVTAQEGEYRRLSEQLYQTLGVAPMITKRADGLIHCSALLAPEGIRGFGALEQPPLLFSPDGREGLTVAAEDVPAPFPEEMRSRYDVFALLTAFRGERLFRDVAKVIPACFREGERRVSIEEAAGRFSP